MIDSECILNILLVEDDEDNLRLLEHTLPTSIENCEIHWDSCSDFTEAVSKLNKRRYDLVVTDIYRDRADHRKGVDRQDEEAKNIINNIRSKRFCPIVVFTDGSAPQSFSTGPFVKLADKSRGNDEIILRIKEIIQTGVPVIAQKIHNELDRTAGSYLWDFLERQWEDLCSKGLSESMVLERLIRRRAAIQIGEINPQSAEPATLKNIEGLEFYIYPPTTKAERCLGEVLQHKSSKNIFVILTPHCHLTMQPGDDKPRAKFLLTVMAKAADYVISTSTAKNPWKGTEDEIIDRIRRRINSPADRVGTPAGRFWFMPGFLRIPDSYCDFQYVGSISYESISSEYESIAVLASPFAEALQSCFVKYYSDVGLPNLNPERFRHLISNPAAEEKKSE